MMYDDMSLVISVSLQELHLLHEFKDEFYGEEIRALLLGFLRLETRFGSLGEYLHP